MLASPSFSLFLLISLYMIILVMIEHVMTLNGKYPGGQDQYLLADPGGVSL